MALINRVVRLFKADFHAVLDRIEEPAQLLKQAIREMENELQSAERSITECTREQAALSARVREIQASVVAADEQLDLCFESGNDELARSLIRRKLEAERLLRRFDAKFAANDSFLDEQRTRLAENRRTLDGLRQKAELFAESQADPAVAGDDGAWFGREMEVADADVEIAFLHEQSRRSAS